MAGEFWITGNQTGNVGFVSDVAGQPSYTETLHNWFGESDNRHNNVSHFTFQVRGTGSDGSTLNFHEAEQIGTSANGDVVVSFDKMTCG